MKTLRNKVHLIGNVGDPKSHTFESGKKVTTFTLATNETYRNANGEKLQDTQWHNLVAWGKTAEIIDRYVTKGKEVAIEGKLTSRSYGNEAGEKHYLTEYLLMRSCYWILKAT